MPIQKQLEILVVEDSPEHIESAKIAFPGPDFNLTLAKDYFEARKLITPLLKCSPEDGNWDKFWKEYREEFEELKETGQVKSKFDVVLTDLLMPTSPTSDEDYQSGYGFPIALMAAKYGVPNIAVVTRGNHHQERIIHGLEDISGQSFEKALRGGFRRIDNSNVLFTCAPVYDHNGIWVKDWKKVYDALVTYDPKK